MFGVADYGAFVAAILIFLAIPGPGNLALITSTGKGGIRGGLAATLGVIAGDQVLMWAAVAGVATLLATYPAAFRVVQWVGAAYLAWLGLRMLLAKPGPKLHPAKTGAEVFHPGDAEGLRHVFESTDPMQETRMEKVRAEALDHYDPWCAAGLALLGAAVLCLVGLRTTPW